MSLYNQTAVVYRASTTTTDGIGGVESNPTVHIAALACRLRVMSANERGMSGSTGVSVSHRMYCGIVDIIESDVLVIDSQTYDVQMVNNVNAMNNHLEIDLLERRPERSGG